MCAALVAAHSGQRQPFAIDIQCAPARQSAGSCYTITFSTLSRRVRGWARGGAACCWASFAAQHGAAFPSSQALTIAQASWLSSVSRKAMSYVRRESFGRSNGPPSTPDGRHVPRAPTSRPRRSRCATAAQRARKEVCANACRPYPMHLVRRRCCLELFQGDFCLLRAHHAGRFVCCA